MTDTVDDLIALMDAPAPRTGVPARQLFNTFPDKVPKEVLILLAEALLEGRNVSLGELRRLAMEAAE
jgi:hypothetical protein